MKRDESPADGTCHAILIAYSINDRASYELVSSDESFVNKTVLNGLQRDDGSYSIPVVLVGNKVDAEYAGRAVTKEEAEQLCEKKAFEAFFEVSTKCSVNVTAAFTAAINSALKFKPELVAAAKARKGGCVVM